MREIPREKSFIPKVDYPADNLPTPDRIVLGEKLFFDPLLSVDGTISCASCHRPPFAFADNVSKSQGIVDVTMRNSPTLINIANRSSYFMDGGAHTLEMAVISPIEDHSEMGLNVLEAVERLNNSDYYTRMSQLAYRVNPSPFVVSRALAAYIRNLTHYSSRYDEYLAGNIKALSPEEIAGEKLFFGKKASCASCHEGVNFTDNLFHNVGLYNNYTDKGRGRVTLNPQDEGKFRTPTLRNLAKTAPYMHDGSIKNLQEVIEHYNEGAIQHPNRDIRIQKLQLTETEKAALQAFLLTL